MKLFSFGPVSAALLASLALAAAAGCGDGTTSTSGKRVVLKTMLATDPIAKAQFTTNFGWKVTLDHAAVAIGALYYFDGTPAFTQLRPTIMERVGSFFEGTAYAHPGHYQAGDALGEMLTPTSFDLYGLPELVTAGDGVTGTYRSARFVFAQSIAGTAAAALGTHVAYASGVAEKADGTTPAPIHFTVAASFTDVAAQTTSGEVDGCVFTEAAVAADGTVTVTVSPNVWFNVVDFTEVAAGTAAAPTSIALTTNAGIGFVNGLTQLDAYSFAYAP